MTDTVGRLAGEKARNGVWVLGEMQASELLPVSLELLGEGLRLSAKLNEELSGVLIGGRGIERAVDLMASCGAKRVYLVMNDRLDYYNCESYTDAFSTLIEYHKPNIILCPATPNGNDFIPRVAARTQAVLIPRCTILNVNRDKTLVCTRPVYGGKFSAIVEAAREDTKIITICPGVIQLEKPTETRKAETVEINLELNSGIKTKRVGFIKGDPKTVDVAEAEIVVAGGGGVRSEDDWKLIETLAKTLGGAVGGSRIAYDRGWIPFERQIGQTGKTVKPKLYVACGISGSTYHTVGVKDSERIIAINTDLEAEIFKFADVCVRGDLREVLAALIERIQPLVGS